MIRDRRIFLSQEDYKLADRSRCPIGIEYQNENQNCDSAMFSIKWQARIVRSDIPSCSSFNARKMISYIHARISENQSNIEILIHDNSTPFLLRDTRAFLPDLCSTNEYLKGKKRGGHSPATHHRSLPNDPNFTVHALSFLFFHEILLLIKSTRSDIIDSRQFSLHQFESNSIDRSPLFHQHLSRNH